MSKRFDAAVADLPRLHTQLVESPLRPVAHSVSDLNFAGIYVLYESGKPVYVGISKNLTKRLRNIWSAPPIRPPLLSRVRKMP